MSVSRVGVRCQLDVGVRSKLFNEQEVPSNSASEIETLYASIQLTKQVTLTNTSIPTTSTLISQLRVTSNDLRAVLSNHLAAITKVEEVWLVVGASKALESTVVQDDVVAL
eukprot:scaffold2378_cov152-Skeletonema_menzelii.AAC.19